MKILVVGASHGVGLETVKRALEMGHAVTALARNAESLPIQHENLRLMNGDAMSLASMSEAVKGQDAVICTLGIPTKLAIGPPVGPKTYILSKGIGNIIAAMKENGVKRLECVTALGTGDSWNQYSWAGRLMLRGGLRWLYKEKDLQERMIRESGLDWTIIRPTAMTNGKRIGANVAEETRAGAMTHVSRADAAAVMVDIVDQPETFGKALTLFYPPKFGDTWRWLKDYRER